MGLALIDDALEEQSEAPEDGGDVPAAPMVVIDAETSQVMVLEPIDEPLAPEPDARSEPDLAGPEPAVADAAAPEPAEPEQAAHDAPTTEIALADIARLDRPLPEETTARIAPVQDAPPDPRPDSPPVMAPPTGNPLPGPAPLGTAAPTSQPEPDEPPSPRPGGAHATRHDFALVMRHGDVRARVAAAVLVPFIVYVAVLAVIGKLEVHYLIWLVAPAVAAGVLVGLVLDAGHRRYPLPAGDPATPVTEPVSEPAGPA